MNKNLIPDIICELLETNKKIVIEGLGYFEITHQSASYDAETKTLYPPIDFLHLKNFDIKSDDILMKKIAEKLNISEDEANEKILLWIDEIYMQLAENQSAAFGEKGEFFIDDENKVSFRFSDKTNMLKDYYGLKEVYFEKVKL
jgi:nucleoid DNA-binding protein